MTDSYDYVTVQGALWGGGFLALLQLGLSWLREGKKITATAVKATPHFALIGAVGGGLGGLACNYFTDGMPNSLFLIISAFLGAIVFNKFLQKY